MNVSGAGSVKVNHGYITTPLYYSNSNNNIRSLNNSNNQSDKNISIGDKISNFTDKMGKAVEKVVNNVALSLSYAPDKEISFGNVVKVTISGNVSKITNNANIVVNADVSSLSNKKVSASFDTAIGGFAMENNKIKEININGKTILQNEYKYVNTSLSIGGSKASEKGYEVKIFEHKIETKPNATNTKSEVTTTVSINRDNLIKSSAAAAIATGIVIGATIHKTLTQPVVRRGYVH